MTWQETWREILGIVHSRPADEQFVLWFALVFTWVGMPILFVVIVLAYRFRRR